MSGDGDCDRRKLDSWVKPTPVSLGLALCPVALLVLLLALSVYYFGDDSSYGGNQIALLLAAALAALIGLRKGSPWEAIESGIVQGVANAMIAILILLMVGALIGTWLLAGTVQTLIYYGLQLISASWFYAAACLVCGVVATVIGSSWTVAGTLGIAFIGMSDAMQLNPAITAGAVISGAYFGDKLSPLSETTNLAAAVTGTELFVHIRHLLWTTIPAFVIALFGFAIIGGEESLSAVASIDSVKRNLQANYELGAHLLLPAGLVFGLAWKRVPALAGIAIGALAGGVFAVLFQSGAVSALSARPELAYFEQSIIAVWVALFDGFNASTGDDTLDELLSRGGMSSMLNTVWLIMCAMTFSAVMEVTGLLKGIIYAITSGIDSASRLIITTALTCIGINIIASDQYISIVVPGRMFGLEFARQGLATENLSRTLEDAGTLTSPLVPWNTCGAFMAGTLGVATLSYLPWVFFNLLGPVFCVAYALSGFRLVPLARTA